MKLNFKKIILFIIMFIFVLMLFETISFAGETFNPDSYKGDHKLQYNDASEIFAKGAKVIKVLRNIAALVSVISLSIIGVRYMVGSVEQKAEYKQTMVPVVIGCVLVGGLSLILTIIQSIFK